MKREYGYRRILKAINNYFTFFLLVAFVISCCLMLFVSMLASDLDLVLTKENISAVAKATFWNVIIISFIFTLIDSVRRKWTIDRPVKLISEAAEKMTKGDFDVRISHVSKIVADDRFNDIIDCINKMAEELSGVETLRTDFIANVSHEMKTPLAVMQNYGTLLQAPDITDEKRVEYARILTKSSKKLADMMTNILKLNRLENQQIFPIPQKYDLGEQICENLLQYEKIWENRGIEIETDIEDNIYISADEELLSLVWNNIFSNAFKFTEMGGKVSVYLGSEKDFAVVKIKDTGCGISPEVGAHIFEKFYQGDTSHATEGNGLGLALVKRIVDITQGEIAVESTVGKGTVFTVKLRRA